MSKGGQKYKVRLASGRLLGPLDLNRVRLLILKKRIQGNGREQAREHPEGDWAPLESIPAIAELLVIHAEGKLTPLYPDLDTAHGVPKPYDPAAPTRILTPEQILPEPKSEAKAAPRPVLDPLIPDLSLLKGASAPEKSGGDEDETIAAPGSRPVKPSRKSSSGESEAASSGEEDETTIAAPPGSLSIEVSPEDLEQAKHQLWKPHEETRRATTQMPRLPMESQGENLGGIHQLPTQMVANPLQAANWTMKDAIRDPRKLKAVVEKKGRKLRKSIVGALSTLAVLYILFELINGADNSPKPVEESVVPVRAAMPAALSERVDPRKSSEEYAKGMREYVLDTVPGYKKAAQHFRLAAEHDMGNIKALSMLASSYLNLIDSSNKDEHYFNVISRLIKLSKDKSVDLPETVIAEIELLLILNKAEAAQNRIVEYTRTHANFGPEMYYYLALTFLGRGEAKQAATLISQYPENRFFSAKVYYLRGQIAERLEDAATALREYQKAIKLNPSHALSRLAIAALLNHEGRLSEAAANLEYIVKNPLLLAPQDLAHAFYLHALLSELEKKTELAGDSLQRAITLDPDNHDYLLELYQLLASGGEDIRKLRPSARMYYFLGQGEKFLQEGRPQDALNQFLQAREANDSSPLPLVKIGDMFYRHHDLLNARANYKKAAEKVPNNIQVWSKYIDTLIQSYEIEDATQAMNRFRKLPVEQSAIDKAAADILARQGLLLEAQSLYKKAMRRDVIDSGVYLAYARNLMALRNCAEAPFFFALALRADPLNVEALVGTARCVVYTEGIDQAISLLQDELQKRKSLQSELLSAIAELQIEKGAWHEAQENVRLAMQANPDYAFPWKLQAQIYLNQDATSKAPLDRALDAYGSYSDRNNSDPSGYLERYRLLVKKGDFERASDELGKIFGIYPKYPNLHFYKGTLYSIMGNHKLATEEYKSELSHDPNSISTLLAYGRELLQQGFVADAMGEFTKAMKIQPRAAEPRMEMGWAKYLQKDFEGAIALYKTAIAFDQSNPQIFRRMGLAYRDKEDAPQATAAFREYLRLEPDAPDKADFEQYLR